MKIDFSNLTVQWNLEGEPQHVDIRKSLGNHIHQQTGDLAEDELAKRIYFADGPIELTDEEAKTVTTYVKRNYVVPVWQAIERATSD